MIRSAVIPLGFTLLFVTFMACSKVPHSSRITTAPGTADAALPDLITPQPDLNPPLDGEFDTDRPDLEPDLQFPDFALPDQFRPDESTPDLFRPDLSVPDMSPDLVVTDFDDKDLFVPPDFGKDTAPDELTPDVVIPDFVIPDFVIPDFGFPDVPFPDVQPDLGIDVFDNDIAPDVIIGCNIDGDCTDLNTHCAIGACQNGVCIRVPHPLQVNCDDGLFCTTGDHCVQGVCVGTQRKCDQPDDPCQSASCSEQTQKCEQTKKQDGEGCVGDPFVCTNQACFNGAPSPTNPCLGCNAQQSQFNFTTLPPGSPCTDANGVAGTCQAGTCSTWSRITIQGATLRSIDRLGPSGAVWIAGNIDKTGIIWQLEGSDLKVAFKTEKVLFRSVQHDLAVGHSTGTTAPIAFYNGKEWTLPPTGITQAQNHPWNFVIGGDTGNNRNYIITGDYNKVLQCFCLLNFGCLNYSCVEKDVLLAPNSFEVDFVGRWIHVTPNPGGDQDFALWVVGSDQDQGNLFQDVASFSVKEDAFLLTGTPLAFTGILDGELMTVFGSGPSNIWAAGTKGLVLSRRPQDNGPLAWTSIAPATLGITNDANLTVGFADEKTVSIFGDRAATNGGRELVLIRGNVQGDGSIKWVPPLAFAALPPGLTQEQYKLFRAYDLDFVPGLGFVIVGTEPNQNGSGPIGVIWLFGG